MTSAKTGVALTGMASLTILACVVSACGPGPTEGPKGPQLPPVAGYAATQPGYAGPTTAQPEKKALTEEERARAREKVKFAEEQRKLDEAAAAAAGDGDPPADSGPDPTGGNFTMAMATAGMAATSGAFTATIKTSKGDLRCKLFDDKAPIATANFVGLARGTRPWKSRGQWVTKPAYDGTTFHRVIKGFMVQGGDPLGSGRGEPGYIFKDELWAGGKHDRAGLLCMANRGPDTNGMQFFITDASAPHLDKSYTIFGECSPVSVVHAIAKVEADPNDKPLQEVKIEKVEITRGGSSAPPAPAAAPGNPPAQPKP